MPSFFVAGSGPVLTGVGCIAGAITWNSAIKDVPLIKIAFPFSVNIVLFIRGSVTETVIVPGVTKGGSVYGSGAISIGGNSSPPQADGNVTYRQVCACADQWYKRYKWWYDRKREDS